MIKLFSFSHLTLILYTLKLNSAGCKNFWLRRTRGIFVGDAQVQALTLHHTSSQVKEIGLLLLIETVR